MSPSEVTLTIRILFISAVVGHFGGGQSGRDMCQPLRRISDKTLRAGVSWRGLARVGALCRAFRRSASRENQRNSCGQKFGRSDLITARLYRTRIERCISARSAAGLGTLCSGPTCPLPVHHRLTVARADRTLSTHASASSSEAVEISGWLAAEGACVTYFAISLFASTA